MAGEVGNADGGDRAQCERLLWCQRAAAFGRARSRMGHGQKKVRACTWKVGGHMRKGLLFRSNIGWVGIAESATGIAAIVFSKTSRSAAASSLREMSEEPFEETESPQLRAAKRQLNEYVAGTRTSFDLPLDVSQGTAFQRRVWKRLQAVPY